LISLWQNLLEANVKDVLGIGSSSVRTNMAGYAEHVAKAVSEVGYDSTA